VLPLEAELGQAHPGLAGDVADLDVVPGLLGGETHQRLDAVLGGFARMIDKQVLDGASDDLDDEPTRERLFDVLMSIIRAKPPSTAPFEG
jgi:hypothetical protein